MPLLHLIPNQATKPPKQIEQPQGEDTNKNIPAAAQALIAAAGLKRKDIKSILEEHELDTDGAIRILASIARDGDTDTVRLRAAEMALKLNGDLKEDGSQLPIVNIIIRDSQSIEVNPILIPR